MLFRSDNWLMTVLQKRYLELFSDEDEKSRHSILFYYLEEIVENKKNYSSLVKRYEDFKEIDNVFKIEINTYLEKSVNEYSDFLDKVEKSKIIKVSNTKTKVNLRDFIDNFIQIYKENEKNNSGCFLSSKLSQLVNTVSGDNLYDILSPNISYKLIKDNGTHIEDCFIVAKRLKIGTDSLLELYDESIGSTKSFKSISHIDETLKLEKTFIPEFFVYIKWKEPIVDKHSIVENLKEQIGRIAAQETIQFFEDNYKKYLHDSMHVI